MRIDFTCLHMCVCVFTCVSQIDVNAIPSTEW